METTESPLTNSETPGVRSESPVLTSPPPVPLPAQAVNERPPFWRRILAFVIDGIVLGVACMIAGLFLGDRFAKLGPWGRVFGGGIGIIYFGLAASPLGHGQTIGKKVTRIAVLRLDGSTLSFLAAFGRATLLMLPIACNGLAVAMTTWVVPTLASVVIFGLGGSILYLFLFNRVTRQTTHDFATRSIVARAESGQISIARGVVWRVHFAILAVILVFAAGIATFAALNARRVFDFSLLRRTQENVASLAHTNNVQVLYGSTWMTHTAQQTWIHTSVVTYASPANREELATSIADVILTDIPAAKSRSSIIVTISTGYDIVFAHTWSSYTWNYTPSEWQNRIAKQRR